MYDKIFSSYGWFCRSASATTRVLSLLLLMVLATGSAEDALAQSTFGSVRGIAQDKSGAVLPGT